MFDLDNESENIQAIQAACLNYLGRREHSQYELMQKVSAKGFARQDVANVIDSLEKQGLQSDARFAESYARSRVHKGFGPLCIQSELLQRGVSDYSFDMAAEDIAGSWSLLLEQVYYKKYGKEVCTDNKEKFKRSRFLQQRGFSSDMIQRLFKQLAL